LCELLNEKNEFKFIIETSKNYCAYGIYYNGGSGCFDLIIRDNDSINILVDLSNSDNTFIASGQGSGFVNFWFALQIFMPSQHPELPDEKVIPYWENMKLSYLNLLKSFKRGIFQKTDSLSLDQVANINRLIKNTNLNKTEYVLIQNRINFCISSAIRRTSFEFLMSNIDQYMQLLKKMDLSKKFIRMDCVSAGLSENYIKLSCFKELKVINDSISEDESYKYLSEHFYTIAKKVLKGENREKIIADKLYDLLMYGDYKKYQEFYSDNKELLAEKAYIKKTEKFYNNYLEALNDKEYNLNSPNKILNDSTVNVLLNSLKGHKVYLILWKISPETSCTLNPIWELPILNKIKAISKDKNLKFIDICLGNDSIKQHWASMIVNHQWKGEHYLYANGNKEEFKKIFKCEDKMKYCSGELYYLLDENGIIIKDNETKLIEEIE
jgi:hypothetical protein